MCIFYVVFYMFLIWDFYEKYTCLKKFIYIIRNYIFLSIIPEILNEIGQLLELTRYIVQNKRYG
mgnify:CR=1 FL=1